MVVHARPRILLAAVAALTLLGGLAALSVMAWADRDAAIAEATDRLGLLARLSESNLRGIAHQGTTAMEQIEEHLGGLAGAALPPRRPWLLARLGELPAARAIRLRDAAGGVLLATDTDPPPLAPEHRPDFERALGHPDRTVMGRRGDSVILLRAEEAAPRRVAEIEIPIEDLFAFHRSLGLRPGDIFSILRTDGTLIARLPMPEGPRHLDPTRHPFTMFAQAPAGSYRARSVIDEIERLAAYRSMPDLDLVLTAGQPIDRLLTDWRNRTVNASLFLAAALAMVLGLFAVIDDNLRRQAELLGSLGHKAAELAAALSDKDVLFQELHHRVKNNLQVIASLLTMQSLTIEDETARAALTDALDRIHSMGLVHQTLYQRNEAANVDLADYFSRLTGALAGNHAGPLGGITIDLAVEGTLDLDRAIPLGMLANEALANTFKHAFAAGTPGTVSVTLGREAEIWRLTIEDDGAGLSGRPGDGIGLGLIRALARQLGGRSEIAGRPGGGTVVRVEFPA